MGECTSYGACLAYRLAGKLNNHDKSESGQMTRNRYFLCMSTIFLTVVIVGFTRSFYLQPYFDFPELPVHLYLHGIALTAWFTLAFIQPWLIKSRHTKLHRKLGAVGVVLAMSVVMTSLWTLALRDAPEIDEFPTRAAPNLALLINVFDVCGPGHLVFRARR